MSTHRPKSRRLPAYSWLCMPTVGGFIGGGLVKLDHGSMLSALVVAVAPFAISLLLCILFAIGYLAAVFRYVRAGAGERDAMERLITLSANAVVSILTLSKSPLAPADEDKPVVPSPRSTPCDNTSLTKERKAS